MSDVQRRYRAENMDCVSTITTAGTMFARERKVHLISLVAGLSTPPATQPDAVRFGCT